jgi:hypothetical protein
LVQNHLSRNAEAERLSGVQGDEIPLLPPGGGYGGVKKMKIRSFEQEFTDKDFLLFIPPVFLRRTPFAPRFRRYPKGAVIYGYGGR